LRKSHIFPLRFEFVGIDVCADGNRPDQSKHALLSTWPAPETVCDVAKFIGFAQFYARFIHNFKLRVAPLREITKQKYTDPVAQYWNEAAQHSIDDMKNVNHINSPLATLYRYSLVMISIGPASLSSTRKLRHFHGQMMVNSNVILPMTPL